MTHNIDKTKKRRKGRGVQTEIRPPVPRELAVVGLERFPEIILQAGPDATRRFLEFFTAQIRNPNTRTAYARAVRDFFAWCQARDLGLIQIQPVAVAAYVEQHPGSAPTVKQHLAAIRMLFDWLVIGQIVPTNPATSVRGPKHVVRRGKTPVLSAAECRALLDSVDTSHVVGLRDRALIAVMVYSFARVSAVVGLRVADYCQKERRGWLRLHEKGGKFHQVPCHHNAEAYLDAFLATAGIGHDPKSPLFRTTFGKTRRLTRQAMSRKDVLRMIKRRAVAAGLPATTSCHTFRATGITTYLENGGSLENAQAIAAHESPRTTKLYDHTADQITLDEVERIRI